MNYQMKFQEMETGSAFITKKQDFFKYIPSIQQIIFTSCLILITNFTFSQSIPKKPSPARFVNDYAKILSEEDIQKLEEKLYHYQDTSTVQIVIVTVESLLNRDIKDLTNDWASQWKIGQKGNDNGLLILVALKEKQIRFEVGYGLEAFLTDSECLNIIKKDMFPAFKNKSYALAFHLALKSIFTQLQNAEFEVVETNQDTVSITQWLLYILIPIVLVVLLGFVIYKRISN